MTTPEKPSAIPIKLPVEIDHQTLQTIDNFFSQLKPNITSCLNYQVNSNWKILNRTLDDDFFFFIVEGKIKAKIGEKNYIFKSNEFVIIPQGVKSSMTIEDNIKELNVIALHGYIHNHWGYSLLKKLNQFHFKLPTNDHYLSQLTYLTSLMSTNQPLATITGNALISQLMLFLIQSKQITTFPKTKLDSRIAKSLDYINNHYMDDLTVTDLAKLCRLSEVRLRKIFKITLDIGPKIYIAQFRINQACQLLKTTQYTIKEISFKTGFNDEHYFHLSFKKYMGKTPTEYRNLSAAEI